MSLELRDQVQHGITKQSITIPKFISYLYTLVRFDKQLITRTRKPKFDFEEAKSTTLIQSHSRTAKGYSNFYAKLSKPN